MRKRVLFVIIVGLFVLSTSFVQARKPLLAFIGPSGAVRTFSNGHTRSFGLRDGANLLSDEELISYDSSSNCFLSQKASTLNADILPGDRLMAYVDDDGDFYVYENGKVTKLGSYPPQDFIIGEPVMRDE